MGKKTSNVYSESDETDHTGDSGSVESIKKKKFSILKYTKNYGKKKKCKVHCRPEIEEPEPKQIRGILKNSGREQELLMSEDDEESDYASVAAEPRCVVGSVPRPAGAKPGRGGGVCLIIRKDTTANQPQQRDAAKRISRRIAYNRPYV